MKMLSLTISLFAAFVLVLPLEASADEVGSVTFTRVGVGQDQGALPFAMKVASYINEAYDIGLTVSVPIGGVVATIIWRAEYESLAAVEAFNNQLLADEGYAALVAEGTGHFVPGSLQDYISRRVQ